MHASAATPDHAAPGPRRVLLLSGSIGAGHHAAAAAVAEAVGAAWPDAEVITSDVLAGMGRGAPRTFPGIYATCVRALPWLYGLYYWLLVHVRFFRAGTRAVLGRMAARSIAPLLDAHRPDLVVTTFPEGVAGLGHLRRAGRLSARVVVVPADPAPQPLWCDADLDAHLVTTEEAARRVRRSAPGAVVHVVGWPVVSAFHPPSPCQRSVVACTQWQESPVVAAPAPRTRLRVLVAAGSLGFGDLPALARAVLAAGADPVLATADPGTRRALDALAAAHPGRVELHRWIDDPATVTRGADAVVTTGGGASAFEALACARPLLVVDPIAGHGRDNARLLARAGLARHCTGPAALTVALRRLADPTVHAATVAAPARASTRRGPRLRAASDAASSGSAPRTRCSGTPPPHACPRSWARASPSTPPPTTPPTGPRSSPTGCASGPPGSRCSPDASTTRARCAGCRSPRTPRTTSTRSCAAATPTR